MKSKDEKIEWYDAISSACQQVFPGRVGKIFATEISVIYYSFFSWKKESVGKTDFTYFKTNGVTYTIGAFVFLIIIETLTVHMLLEMWSARAAWILTFLSLYTCLQVVALLRSMDKRLISVDHGSSILIMRYGFFNQTKIPFSAVVSIEENRRALPEDGRISRLSPLGMLDPHNLILTLSKECEMEKIYGFRERFDKVAFYIDNKEDFVENG